MRIIEYIKWTYGRQDAIERALTAILLVFVLGGVLSIWFGELAFVYAIFVLIAMISLFVIVSATKLVYMHWQRFNRENPPEDVRIMNKLRGHDDREPNSGFY